MIGASTLPPTNPAALTLGPVTAVAIAERQHQAPPAFLFLAVATFMGLYPSWVIQHVLATHSVGTIGIMLLLGEIDGLFGAFLSGRLSLLFRHPLGLRATAAIGIAAVVLVIPFAMGLPLFQAFAHGPFVVGGDLPMALMLGSAMPLVGPAQRGGLNAILHALYQTEVAVGGMASGWLCAFSGGFHGQQRGCHRAPRANRLHAMGHHPDQNARHDRRLIFGRR
jgi:hypothetical protein